MSDTTQLFILAGAWSIVALFVARIPKRWPGKSALFLILVGIPFWELPYGYYNFKRACSEQGGLRVFEKIGPQKAICVANSAKTSASTFLNMGFSSVEVRDENDTATKAFKFASSQIHQFTGSIPQSQYCVTHSFVQDLPWRIQRNEYVLVGAIDKRVVAKFADFVWYGTWWQQSALPVFGRGGECRHAAPLQAIGSALLNGTN